MGLGIFLSPLEAKVYTQSFFVIYLDLKFLLKSLPAMWETWVLSLVWEDPLEKEMAPHASILA